MLRESAADEDEDADNMAQAQAQARAQAQAQARAYGWALDSVCLYCLCLPLLASLAAYALRRHLMVWAVFAPKLAFEACLWAAQASYLALAM